MNARTWALVTGLLLSLPAVAAAQEADGYNRDEEARGLFLAGRAAYSAGRFEEALTHFERSYELSKRAELLYNIGSAAERSGHPDRAIEAFEAYLEAFPTAENRGEVEARIDSLERQLESRPDAADGTSDLAEPSWDRDGEPAEPSEAADGQTEERGAGLAPWLVIGGSGAALVTGAVLFALGQKDIAKVEDAPDGSSFRRVEDAYDRGPTFSTVGVVLMAAGMAGAAAGIVWVVALGGGDGEREMRVGVTPSGVLVRGRF